MGKPAFETYFEQLDSALRKMVDCLLQNGYLQTPDPSFQEMEEAFFKMNNDAWRLRGILERGYVTCDD
jgi:hypothetical protein